MFEPEFRLHQRLQQDTVFLGRLPLCEVLLMNDSRYPWLILVPRRAGITEIHQLIEKDQQELMRESVWVSEKIQAYFQAKKMNIAALGNMVPQLHVHHIARFENDDAWPKPVWGMFPAIAYTIGDREVLLEKLRLLLKEYLI